MEDDKKKQEMWNSCKIVEEDENGELLLLQDNVDKLQQYLKLDECDVADLNIISVIGARENENAFLTNLLRLYLEKNGKSNWTTSLSKKGLEGFAFGTIIKKEEREMTISSTKDNEENLLQRADINNQQDPPDEKNPTQVKEENEGEELDIVCESFSGINIGDDRSTISDPKDEKDLQSIEDPSPETSKAGISRKEQVQLYKIISKLIVHVGVLPKSCGEELSSTTKDLYTAAQRFEEISINGKDDVELGVEDFVMIDVDTDNSTLADFVESSEALMKHYQMMQLDPDKVIQAEANQGENSTGKMENSNGQVENSTGQGESSTGQGESSTGQGESSTGQGESSTGQGESGTGQGESSTGQGENSTGQGKSSTGQGESSTNQVDHNNSRVVECTVGHNWINNGQKNCKEEQRESPKGEQKDLGYAQTDIDDNMQSDCTNILETCLDQDCTDNGTHRPIISSKLYTPDENKSAIYVYPEFVSSEIVGKETKWCILHLHKKSNVDTAEDDQKLEQFLSDVCTRIVWISDKQTTNAALVTEQPVEPNLHPKCVTIFIENEEDYDFRCVTLNSRSIQVPKNIFSIDHDGSGILNLSGKHYRSLFSILKLIIEFQIDRTKGTTTKAASSKYTDFTQYITHKLSEFDLSLNSLERRTSRDERKIPQMSAPSTEVEHANLTPPLSNANKNQDDKKIDATLAANMGALTVTKTLESPEDKVIEATTRENFQELERKLAEWIEKELDMGNLQKILTLYETWLDDIIKKISKTSQMKKANMTKIKECMKQRASEKYRPVIEEVVANLETFCTYFRDQFEKKLCFQKDELEKRLEEQKTRMVGSSKSKETVKMMNLGYFKLAGILKTYNQKLLDAGKTISVESADRIRNVYAKKMEKFLSSKIPIDPINLQGFHDELTSNLIAAYEKCLQNDVLMVKQKEKLHQNLLLDFHDFFERNMLILELSQKKVKGYIGKSKSGYEEIMDNLLKENKCGINPEEFEKTHLEESSKAEKLLKHNILSDEKLNEPVEVHLVTLKKHIEKSYKTFKGDNEEFLEKNQNLGKSIESDGKNKGSKNLPSKPCRKHIPDSDTQANDVTPKEPANKKLKRDLPPLLYQIALGKIGVGTLPVESWESDSAPINITSHSGEIGILMDGKWVCGDEVKAFNQKGMLQKCWSFEAIFSANNFDDTVFIKGESIHITLPFLLGVLLGMLKQKAENEQSGEISAAMISVPFWFSTKKRIQVVEAGTIAGFNSVQLVNENTASAYFAYTSASSPPYEKMVVISENSNRVDISIYSYNQHSKTISMEGHSGDYETAKFIPKDKNFIQFVTGIFVYLFKNAQEEGIQQKALKGLEKLWDLAKSRVSTPIHLEHNNVLICCESDHWRELLWKFAGKITSEEKISIRNDSPFLGLASFFHVFIARKNGSLHSLFKEALPFDVIGICQKNEKRVLVKKKNTFLGVGNQTFRFELPKPVGTFSIYEDDLSLQRLGKFHVKSRLPYSYTIECHFQRSQNEIIEFAGVEYTEGDSYALRKPLEYHYFEWQPCKTPDDTLVVYRSLMDQIKLQMKVASTVGQASKEIEETVNKIKKAIDEGKGEFKSSLGKNMLIKQVDNILEALKQEGIQEKQLKKHVTYLESIVQKHKLQI